MHASGTFDVKLTPHPASDVTVVPDSGTGDLVRLTGRMTIKIDEGKHFYEFEYALGAAR
jgi:hypothetical protein